jgi:iron complex transport system substrate-binding protein
VDARNTDQQAPDRRARRGSFIAAALLAALLLPGSPGPALSAQEPSSTDFPVTLVDDTGVEVTIAARPERIASLSPANTEIVFALGAGDRLVGGTDYDDFPAEATALPDLATYNGLVRERLVDVQPDLVLAAGNGFTPDADIAWLRESGYPVVVLYAGTVDAVLADIELVGRAIGEPAAAADLTGGMADRIADVREAVTAMGTRPRTFYQVGSEPELYAPAPNSFLADMVALAGGEPITTSDPAVFSVPQETLLAADPEVIVLGDANYGVCPADVAARPGWSDMTAVRAGAIRPVDDVPVTRPGPRLADGLAALARAIHPDLQLEGVPVAPAPCEAAVP